MFRILCWVLIAVFLSCIARCAEAAEVIVMVDRLVYAEKYYGSKSGFVSTNTQQLEPTIYCEPINNNSSSCNYSGYYQQDKVRALASLMVARSESGLGWYGTLGMWQWETLKWRPEGPLNCFSYSPMRCYRDVDDNYYRPSRSVVYAGGGLQYRFDWSRISLTPFAGVVGHWPRIESVSGTTHLFQVGFRASMKLSARSELLIQYSHFSNGSRLQLADQNISNQGIEVISFGFSYRL